MELPRGLEASFNDQIQAEYYSSYLYLAMSAYLESIDMPGFAHWMRVQSKEEMAHALKFFGYIHDRGGRAVLQAIQQPASEFGKPLDVAKATLAHEKHVTARIEALFALAQEEHDYAAQVFLQWFLNEQVEEEDHARKLVAQLEQIGDHASGLIMLDRALAARE